MFQNKFFTFLGLFILLTGQAFAAPTINSALDDNFDQNAISSSLSEITVVDDLNTPEITTETGIRITIPDDIEIIFDQKRTSEYFNMYGTALDNGKVLQKPVVTFENKDKTIVIPVEADFSAGEYVKIQNVYVKGFHVSPTESRHLMLEVGDTTATDARSLYIYTSSNEDRTEPLMPTNVAVVDDPDGVKITWDDPTDLDLKFVEILKGKNEVSVNGVAFQSIPAGTESYIDTDVEIGDTVRYILRATDGPNYSENTEEIDFVVGSTPAVTEPTPEDTTEPTVDETTTEDQTTTDTTEDTQPEESTPTPSFNDLNGHWAKEIIIDMAARGIVTGNPDGSFNPNGNLNRAEAAALLYRALGLEDPTTPSEKPFSDVSITAWFAGYIDALKALALLNGNPDGTYKPENSINRAEFVELALNLYSHLGSEDIKMQIINLKAGSATSIYSDLDSAAWYSGSVTAATELGLINGAQCSSSKCFNASTNITRAEATKILQLVLNSI